MSLEVVVLNCRNCGASLSIPPGLEQVACSFCGTPQIVRRAGGVTYLERDVAHLREGIARVESQVGQIADATADAGNRLRRLETQGDLIRLDREREGLHFRLERGRLGCFGWAAVVLAVSAVVSAFERSDARVGGLVFAGAVGVVLLIRANTRNGVRRRIAEIDAEMVRLSDGD
jgi:LSD1 subclass zinc finger protein